MLNKIGIGHVLLETDSPYLTPEEKIGEMNTPLNIKYVIRKIAEEVNENNNVAINFYEKNGFKTIKNILGSNIMVTEF